MHNDLETIYENMLTTRKLSSDMRPEYQSMYAEKPVDAFENPSEPTPPEESLEKDVAEKILQEAKALRKIAKENNYDSKIYYRARKICQLAEQLLGVESLEHEE